MSPNLQIVPPVLRTTLPSSPSCLIKRAASAATAAFDHGPTRRNFVGKLGPMAQVKNTSVPCLRQT